MTETQKALLAIIARHTPGTDEYVCIGQMWPCADLREATQALAAPDLYTALEDAERFLTSWAVPPGYKRHSLDKARAALAKARGEAPS